MPDRSPETQPTRLAPGSRAWQAVWRVADPKITLASVASVVLGAGVAGHDGPLAWGWLLLTLIGIFCIEAAKNASGEIFDWDSGTDQAVSEDERTPFSGGKRVLVDGLLTRRQVWLVASVFYTVGIGCGSLIVVLREPNVLWLGMLGVALAFFYHAPPLKLSYRGLGELAVAVAYGPVIACGTYLVQRHHIGTGVVLSAIPLGLSIMAFLWINEFPDRRADAAAGKRTLVVRLGRVQAARVFGVLIAVVHFSLVALPLFGPPPTVWLGLAGLPHAVAAASRLLRHSDTPAALVKAQTWTLQSFLLLASGSALGWWLDR